MRKVVRATTALARRIFIGRVPKLFDETYYLRHNGDVAASGVDPYLHYVWRGAAQDRDPAEDFDTAFFRRQSGPTRLDPIRHYIKVGVSSGFDPHPNFSSTSYLGRYPDVAASGSNPLLHYRMHGRREGRDARASAKMFDLVALQGVPSKHVRTLSSDGAITFSIRLLRVLAVDQCKKYAQRQCFLLPLHQEEIAILINALDTMSFGNHESIILDIVPKSKIRLSHSSVLAAFDHCYVADSDNEKCVRFRYGELRLWDLRPAKPRVAEIFSGGFIEFEKLG